MALAGLCLMGLSGCEMHSFFDPSVVGRWQRTPVVLPILDQLDVVDEPTSDPPGLSQVQPEDLIATVHEYVMGPSDIVTITVFELLMQGQESVQTRRVNELGDIRLPVVGTVHAGRFTPSQLERKIADILADKGVLKEATVSVIVQDQRQNTFSVIAESTYYGTSVGTYNILGPNFRLLDAIALARGVPGQTKKLYIIRQAHVEPEVYPTPGKPGASGLDVRPPEAAPAEAAPGQPADLIQDLMKGIEPEGKQEPAPDADQTAHDARPRPAPPAGLEAGLDHENGAPWVELDGKWIRADQAPPGAPGAPGSAAARAAAADKEPVVAQRIIEVPYDKLIEGDTRYNIVIQPGDVIRVPPPVIGNVYIGGPGINRPGTYQLPGDRDLTLMRLIYAAGNLSGLAIPERVDLTRRIGRSQQATVRLNLRAIFQGTEPDLFLKPNDAINIGTNFMATPLAVIRNGFRASYGFGFVLDRNFSEDAFGPLIGN